MRGVWTNGFIWGWSTAMVGVAIALSAARWVP